MIPVAGGTPGTRAHYLVIRLPGPQPGAQHCGSAACEKNCFKFRHAGGFANHELPLTYPGTRYPGTHRVGSLRRLLVASELVPVTQLSNLKLVDCLENTVTIQIQLRKPNASNGSGLRGVCWEAEEKRSRRVATA
eukprot:3131985-Rhodomonas_salina.1